LAPEERRERVFLKAAYRDAYLDILGNEDRMTLPRYFWRKWLPILGAEAAALFVILRDTAQRDGRTGDVWCWPDQSELGRMVGVSEKTVRKYLTLLESHGFITKERTRVPVGTSWQWRQGTNRYTVWQDIPLIASDAVELLLRQVTHEAGSSGGRSSRLSEESAEVPQAASSPGSGPGGTFSRRSGEEFREVGSSGGKISRANVNVSNVVSNVRKSSSESSKATSALGRHPRVAAMGPQERARRDSLAFEVSECLGRMGGDRSGRDHKSAGFHRLVSFLMPEVLVREAIRATRDAWDARKVSGDRVGAYFGGIVKRKAEEHGIDLGLGRPRSGPGSPESSSPQLAGSGTEAELPAEEIRRILREDLGVALSSCRVAP
jgi:hypothetical protein